MAFLVSFLSGVVFAVGLALSGMTMPSKIIGFLDIAGDWDPTLAFVMGGALAVYLPFYRWVRVRERPVVAEAFHVPLGGALTWQLVAGAALFGLGWGLAGFCPAPAITAVPSLGVEALAVTGGIVGGIMLYKLSMRLSGPVREG